MPVAFAADGENVETMFGGVKNIEILFTPIPAQAGSATLTSSSAAGPAADR
jgi:hypothetical protein